MECFSDQIGSFAEFDEEIEEQEKIKFSPRFFTSQLYPMGVQDSDYVVFSTKGQRSGNICAGSACSKRIQKEIVNTLKIAKLNDQKEIENLLCVICYGRIGGKGDVRKSNRVDSLSCSHKFHSKCIKQWFEMKKFCPICRTNAITVLA